jgi:acetyl-CoA C-acetyltransferase
MANLKTSYPKNVYIVDGIRTPFLKATGKPGPFSAADLAVQAGRELLARQPFSPADLDEVIIGCVMPSSEEANIARIISLRLGCPKTTPAYTVQRNCASGMQSLDSAAKDISLGRSNLVLVGGTEAMSRAPLLFNEKMLNWMADWRAARNLQSRLKVAAKFRPGFLAPVIALINGLTDPLVGMIMGQTAENLAYRFKISREAMDDFALKSHQRISAAQDNGHLQEVMPVYSNDGQVFELDNGVRRDSSPEKLAKLKPIFDKFGAVTAGNSSQVSDGAALMILASEEAVKRYKLPVLGRLIDTQWAGVEPAEMGLGPVHATVPLLTRNQLTMDDIDYWEINEAFAVQVLACLAAWADDKYCRENLGLQQAFGKLDQSRLNVDGGAVALGHPVGASGARIILHLLDVLKRNKAKRGVATICIGGGQGGAMLLETV